jgi:hypothetical protein
MDDKIKIVKYIVIGIVCALALIIGSCQTTKYQIRKVIESGKATAFEAECALSNSCNANTILMQKLIEKQID